MFSLKREIESYLLTLETHFESMNHLSVDPGFSCHCSTSEDT